MYLSFVEATTTPGARRAFLEREAGLHDLLAKQPGLRVAISVRSLGYPLTYARGTLWDGVDAWDTFMGSTELEAWIAANAANSLATITRPFEAYDLIADVGQPATGLAPGMHLQVNEWTLDQGKARAFEQSRKELFEVLKANAPGWVRSSLYRFMGAGNRYLVIHTSKDRAAALAVEGAAPLQAFVSAHPGSAYSSTPVRPNAYQVTKVTRHA